MSAQWTQLKSALSVRASAFRSYSHTVVPKRNRHRFLMVSAAVALIAIVALPKNDVVTPEAQAATPVITPDLAVYDMSTDLQDGISDERVVAFTLKSGDNLGPLLQKNGLSGTEAYRVTQAFSASYKPQHLRAGQTFQMHFTDDRLDHLTFRPNVEASVFVSRQGEDFTSRKIEHEFKYETVSVASKIKNSLYVDATKLGAPDRVVQQFANIYEYSVDFQRDIQPGDSFEMFFEVARDRNGTIVKSGDLLYTSFAPRGKQSEYWLYTDSKSRENFYDADGKTAKRKLRATPVNGARLSSSFGKRRHPILGYRKMHTGVDFAAPRGTPILAAGSGTVERANRYGGYGNYILIRHTDGYKTAYAHLKSFARGVRSGSYVKQDQVIGYVGTTGRSTGPHLHYEVHLNGKKINPRRLSQLAGKPLSSGEKPAFAKRRAQINTQRDGSQMITDIAPQVAEVSDPAVNVQPAPQ